MGRRANSRPYEALVSLRTVVGPTFNCPSHPTPSPCRLPHLPPLLLQVYWANSTTGAMVSENPITDADIIVMKRRRDKGLPYHAPQLVDDDLNPLPGGEDWSAHPY